LVLKGRSSVRDCVADPTCPFDLSFAIAKPTAYLRRLKRMPRKDGGVWIGKGHPPRATARRKLAQVGLWTFLGQPHDHQQPEATGAIRARFDDPRWADRAQPDGRRRRAQVDGRAEMQ